MLLGALMVLMVTAALATEDVNTANFMPPYCKLTREEASANTTNAMIWGRCSGIIHGLIEMFGLLQEEQAAGEIQLNQRLCTVIPEGVTPQQLVDVVVKFGEAHPEITHEPFVLLTLVAINETWPCKNSVQIGAGGGHW
jgi:Rap1a immunity proteins